MSEYNKNEVIAELKNVSKTIGNKKIIDDLNLTINKGEILGLLGPNGAGKTTTIRMIVGLMSMTEGDILINNHSIKTNFEKAISYVGGIVENPEMYKFLTGYKNLVHYARMTKGVTKERIEEVVELVGLQNAIHQKVKSYSLGMRQRLGLAQALLHKPSLLILDEPTNGLDPAGIKDLREYLKRIATEDGVAVLVSSHLLSEMEMMCSRIAIIQNGKLVSVEDVEGFVNKEENESVAFIIEGIEKAKQILLETFSEYPFEVKDEELVIKTKRQNIPKLTAAFVHAGVDIYEIKVTSKTLEEKFLEVTGGNEIV